MRSRNSKPPKPSSKQPPLNINISFNIQPKNILQANTQIDPKLTHINMGGHAYPSKQRSKMVKK